jgi:uncharacterized membrane protein
MRQINLVGRGVLAVAVVAMLSMPAEARTNTQDPAWTGSVREQIAKIVKFAKKVKGSIVTLGDGLSDPKP